MAAPLLAGDGPTPPVSAPGRDPFLEALAGRSGPDLVAAPEFDPDEEAVSWTSRPRRDTVDALAARWLRGEATGWSKRETEWPALAVPPSRVPVDLDPSGVPVTDRLAAWVPGDAAAVFFDSLQDAEAAVEGLAEFLPRAIPSFCDDSRGWRRDAIGRATNILLLPTIWGANPGVRTGTRQIALVVSDPDLRWAPDIALIAEVDDASLVRSHRQASLRWEERRAAVLRVEGLDAVSDDGAVRSYFGLESGIAVWSTTRTLRERVLAAGAFRESSLLRPDSRSYALARKTFPAAEGGALLVVPDAFLARASGAELRARRSAAIRCEALRMILDARSLSGSNVPYKDTHPPACPAGGTLRPVVGNAGSSCSLHGTAASPVPMGDVPAVAPASLQPLHDVVESGAIPVAARWREKSLEVLVPPEGPGLMCLDLIATKGHRGVSGSPVSGPWERQRALSGMMGIGDRASGVLSRLVGMVEAGPTGVSRILMSSRPPEGRPGGGVLRVALGPGGGGSTGDHTDIYEAFILEWR